MDEERRRRLIELAQANMVEEKPAGPTLESVNARAAEKGLPPITPEQFAQISQVGKAPEDTATVGEKGAHVAGKWLGGVLDVADIPAYIEEGRQFIDKEYPRLSQALSYHPMSMLGEKAREYMPDALAGREKATETVPGLTQAREFSQGLQLTPEQLEAAPGTEYLGRGAEWVGIPGASAPAAAYRTFKAGKEILPEVLKATGRDARVGAITGTSAATGAAVGDLAGETGSTIGELIGGASGLIAAIKTGKFDGLSRAQLDMLAELRRQLGDDPEVLATLQRAVDEGEIGTLLDLTKNRDLANIEAALENTVPGSKALPKVQAAREAQVVQETEELLKPIGGPIDVETSARAIDDRLANQGRQIANRGLERIDEINEGLWEQTQKLQNTAKEADSAAAAAAAAEDAAATRAAQQRTAVDPGGRPDEYSTAAAGKYNAAEEAYANEVSRPAWKAFDDGPPIDATPLRAAANDFYAELKPEQRQILNEKYASLVRPISKWNKPLTPDAIAMRIQQMKDTVAKARAANDYGWEEIQLEKLYRTLEDTLAQPAISPEYAKAVAATKEGYDRFGPAFIGDTRRATAETPETLLQSAGMTGDRGAATARLINESKVPELQNDISNYILAEAAQQETLGPGFLNKYRAVLDNLDAAGYNTRAQIQELIAAEGGLKQATKAATRARDEAQTVQGQTAREQERLTQAAEKQRKATEKETQGLVDATRSGVAGQYAKGYEQADAVVDDILTKPDGAERLSTLREDLIDIDMAAGADKAQAMTSFETRVADRLGKRLFDLFDINTTNVGKPQKRSALGDFRDMRGRLVRNEILPADDAQRIDDLLSRIETENMRARGRASVGNVTSTDTEWTNLQASGLASALLGWLPGAYNLQMGGAARRYFKNYLEARPTKENVDALVEYVTKPDEFLKGIEKLDSQAARQEFILAKFVGAAQAAEIMAMEEDE